jgi:hypothetical protein
VPLQRAPPPVLVSVWRPKKASTHILYLDAIHFNVCVFCVLFPRVRCDYDDHSQACHEHDEHRRAGTNTWNTDMGREQPINRDSNNAYVVNEQIFNQ